MREMEKRNTMLDETTLSTSTRSAGAKQDDVRSRLGSTAATPRRVNTSGAILEGVWFDTAYLRLTQAAMMILMLVTLLGSIFALNTDSANAVRALFAGQADIGRVALSFVNLNTLLACVLQVILTIVQFAHRFKHRSRPYLIALALSSGMNVVGWFVLVIGLPPAITTQNIVLTLVLIVVAVAADMAPERYLVRS